jgi:hypothetical protein
MTADKRSTEVNDANEAREGEPLGDRMNKMDRMLNR